MWQAGGFPLEFPVMSLGETMLRPTAMLFRNLMSMDVEESLRGNPVDATVLLTGCDKTTPAAVMGAASVDLPAIVVTGGPMLNGKFRGCDIGSGTAVWQYTQDLNAGRMTPEDYLAAEQGMTRSNGHCMTMGTASTMACMTEALGPAAARARPRSRRSTPAATPSRSSPGSGSSRWRTRACGSATSSPATRSTTPSGSTRRSAARPTRSSTCWRSPAGSASTSTLADMDRWARDVPWLVDLQPSGQYLMEDFYYAGGLPAVMAELGSLLRTDAITVTGRSVGDNVAPAHRTDGTDVIRPVEQAARRGRRHRRADRQPVPRRRGGQAVGRLRTAARSTAAGRWSSTRIEDYDQRASTTPTSTSTPTPCWSLQNSGPRGYPGMPEVGNLTIPKKLAEQGVDDMVRISDARMSGTAYGTVVLHVTPEAAVGGPLGAGAHRRLDQPGRAGPQPHLEVDDAELARRREEWEPPTVGDGRGWQRLYVEHVMQADKGCDLDFLVGCQRARGRAAVALMTLGDRPATCSSAPATRCCEARARLRAGRFPDGAAYRVEIPSCEGPRVMEAVLDEAGTRGVRVDRVSQGSGVMMLTDDEIGRMVALGREHDVEVNLFLGPRGAWGTGAQAKVSTAVGAAAAGNETVAACVADTLRAVRLGVHSVLVGDLGRAQRPRRAEAGR